MGTYIRLVDINDAKGKESAFLSAVQDKNNSNLFEASESGLPHCGVRR